MRWSILLTLGLLPFHLGALRAQTAPAAAPTPENILLARQVLTAQGAEQTLVTSIEASLSEQRRRQSSLPPIFWDSLTAELRRRAPEIVDSLAPVYAGLFSAAQLNDLLSFYKSPTGHRMAEVQGELVTAMGAVGQRWGARVALDVMKRLVDQGVTFSNP